MLSGGPLAAGPIGSVLGRTAIARRFPYLIQKGEKLILDVRVKITGPISGTGPKIKGSIDSVAYVAAATLTLENNDVYTAEDLEAISAFPNVTAYNDQFDIDWELSRDGTNWESLDTSTNVMYVCLEDPNEAPLDEMSAFLTVVHFACGDPGSSDADQARDKTWGLFSTGSGPANPTDARDRKLYYYQPGTVFAFNPQKPFAQPQGNPTTVQGLLQVGTGQCIAWAHLLQDAWALNGVPNQWNEIWPDGAGYLFVKNWSNTVSEFLFPTSQVEMLPSPAGGNYGPNSNFHNDTGLAGQNSATPSQKVFGNHQILKSGTNTYYDPSYGLIYTGVNKAAAIAQFVSGVKGYGDNDGTIGGRKRLLFTQTGTVTFSV